MGKKQELKADIVLKNYWNDNAQFADLFNAVLFDGKQVIKSEELESKDTESSSILEHKGYAESLKASRDIIKVRKKSTALNVEFVLLGLESQERIHYAMPMRIMGYDYSSYKKQYDDNAKQYKTAEDMDDDEYLSRMKRTDKFIPVITVVVYYGEKAWDGAKSLHEMLEISEEIAPFINDYKMLLVEARQNNLSLSNINNQDLFNLLQIILNLDLSKQEKRKKAIEYSKEHETDKSVIMTIAGATNCKLDYDALAKKGELDMCSLFEATRIEGKIEGKLEGKLEGRAMEIIEMGIEFGLSENDILERLQKKLNISLQEAKGYLQRFGKESI